MVSSFEVDLVAGSQLRPSPELEVTPGLTEAPIMGFVAPRPASGERDSGSCALHERGIVKLVRLMGEDQLPDG
jgi:hypothetical protein